MLRRKKSKRYHLHGRGRYLGKKSRITKSCGFNIRKSESLVKSVFENGIDDDKNHADEFDEDIYDIKGCYAAENDVDMERHCDLKENNATSITSVDMQLAQRKPSHVKASILPTQSRAVNSVAATNVLQASTDIQHDGMKRIPKTKRANNIPSNFIFIETFVFLMRLSTAL